MSVSRDCWQAGPRTKAKAPWKNGSHRENADDPNGGRVHMSNRSKELWHRQRLVPHGVEGPIDILL